ncbi:MAG: hypothetical protein Q8P41_02170 [Pseudomonadota bacterium]|nr:hypothetical protein [Pseudomonadota bacterium]
MVVLLLAGCIENVVNSGPKDEPTFDTGAPVEDTADTDTTETDTGLPDTGDTVDTDTGLPVDTAVDTDVPVDTSEPVDTGEEVDTEPPGPLTVDGVCDSYSFTSWADSASTVPELNVVGVYESQVSSPGPAYVTVGRNTEMVLFLTSYSGVDWQVDLDAGTNVTEIVVSSYDVSNVTFVSATTAPVTYAGWIGACAYEIPDMNPSSGCETPDLELAAEAYSGLAMSSFQGCYAGGEFTVE